MKELEPKQKIAKDVADVIPERPIVSLTQLGKNAIEQNIRTSEFTEAAESMTQEELQNVFDKELKGE